MVEGAANNAESVQLPYLGLAGALCLLAVIIAVLRLPEVDPSDDGEAASATGAGASAWSYSHLVFGAIAIFVYVGAEVSIGSFLVSFLAEPNIAAMQESQAAKYVSFYWGGAMVGRFIGAIAMQKIAGGKALAFNAFMALSLIHI